MPYYDDFSQNVSKKYTVSQKTHQLWNSIAQNCNDQFWWNLAEIFKRLQNRVCMFQFPCRFAFLWTFRLSNRTPKITPILTLNAATPFSKEGTILMKNLFECKGYNAWHFMTEFPDKGWMKNSINGEVKKVRNSRHVNKAKWCVIFVNFGDAI